MGTPALQRLVARMAKRYPTANYGWGNAARSGRLARAGDTVVLYPANVREQFDCLTASVSAKAAITKAGYDATILGLSIPIGDTGAFAHNVVEVSGERGDCTLVGFTPLDRLLGIDPLRHFTPAAYKQLTRECDGYFFGVMSAEPATELQLDEQFYPFRARFADRTLVLTEISYRRSFFSHHFQLRGAFIDFDAANYRLVENHPLEATYSFNRMCKSVRLFPDFWQEISANRRRWSFNEDFSPATLNRPWPILEALREDWPDFARLISQLF
ncbi:MAG: hypothetical protein WC529_02595 [Candidatus Margulisiibacteriota bacterium]